MRVTPWFKIFCVHFAIVAIVLTFLCLLFPDTVCYCYQYVAHFILYIFVAYKTFDLSRKFFLNERLPTAGKAVLITGCGSGFGYLLAQRLHSLGFHVFASCRNVHGEGAQELARMASRHLQVLPLDVRSDESIQKAFDFVKDNLGTSELFALVNNAGVAKSPTLEFTSVEDFKETMEVNTFGLVRVTKAFLPLLKKSKGRVVNVTSAAGKIPLAFMTAYCMSKSAAIAYTQCLSQEMRIWGVRAISIEPEVFRTAINSKANVDQILDMSTTKVSKDILEDYGEEFIEKQKKLLDILAKIPFQRDSCIVIDDMVSALTQKYPSHVYRPRHNVVSRAVLYISQNLPYEFQEMMALCLYRFIDFPIPKSLKH